MISNPNIVRQNFPLHQRSVLVPAEAVAAVRGVSVEKIYDLADGDGENSLLWVWNVGTDTKSKRELRFWSREINAPQATQRLALDEVISALVPRRAHIPGQFDGLRNWEVGELLFVSRRLLIFLRDELQAQPHNGGIYIPRARLENFLRARWIFAGAGRAGWPRQKQTTLL